MWPGRACLIGGQAATVANSSAASSDQIGSIPTATLANGIFTPADAMFYLNNQMKGMNWPSLPDPSFSSVRFLCHMDERGTSQGNTRMLPPSRAPNDCDAFEAVNSGISGLIRDQRVFGLYGMLPIVASGHIVHNTGAVLTLGSGDLTIEGWFYSTNNGVVSSIWDFRSGAGDTVRPLLRLNSGKFSFFQNGVEVAAAAAAASLNTWHHFAWCKDTGAPNKSFLYVDGVSVANFADTTNYSTAGTIRIGLNFALTVAFGGYLDEFRITTTVARYPGGTTFTVPVGPFPDY